MFATSILLSDYGGNRDLTLLSRSVLLSNVSAPLVRGERRPHIRLLSANHDSLRGGDLTPWFRYCIPWLEAVPSMAVHCGSNPFQGGVDRSRGYPIGLGPRRNIPSMLLVIVLSGREKLAGVVPILVVWVVAIPVIGILAKRRRRYEIGSTPG